MGDLIIEGARKFAVEQLAIEIRNLSKSFGGVPALRGVSISIAPMEIHALVGANGSGKSTIVKSLAGYHDSVDSGEVVVRGVHYSLPLRAATAMRAEIRFVHQDLGLIDQMSVADNVCLYAGFVQSVRGVINRRASEKYTRELLDGLGIHVAAEALVGSLGPTERVMVAVARATDVRRQKGVLVLDEPTAAVPISEAARILSLVKKLRDSGWAVLYISHHLDEVVGLADRITVLRDGEIVGSDRASEVDVASLTSAIVGDSTTASFDYLVPETNNLVTERSGVSLHGGLRLVDVSGRRVKNVNLDFESGQIVGITGPTGSGKSELARLISGAEKIQGGRLELDGQSIDIENPRDAIDKGIGYVPQDRIKLGILSKASVRENISGLRLRRFLSKYLIISRKSESTNTKDLMKEFGIVPQRPELEVGTLSGGNQQKVVLARASQASTKVLVLDDPTSGVDVGARAQIQGIVHRLSQSDVVVALMSSDLDELISLCNRVVVLRRGEIVADLKAPIRHDTLARAVFGG
ncbi:MAG: sugar ABC transporter ATP-binding protein [Acidimicrobiales bacterium]